MVIPVALECPSKDVGKKDLLSLLECPSKDIGKKDLASVKCEYIDITGSFVFQNCAESLSSYLPGLLGLKLNISDKSIKSCDFLSTFKCLEQLSLNKITDNGLINTLCNMDNGLKYLHICGCSLSSQDLSCLAMSKHTQTLLQLDLYRNNIGNDCNPRIR